MKLSPPILEAVRVSLGMRVDHFSQKTVIMLMRHIDALDEENKQIKTDKARAVAAADRLQGDVIRLSNEIGKARIAEEDHIRTIAGLRKEIRRLQDEVDEAREAKKVPLPREVAEALASAWNKVLSQQAKSVKHLAMTNWDMLQRRADKEWSILFDYAQHNPVEYMTAIVNGYTIERTPEERLRDGIKDVIARWDMETAYGAFPCAPFLPERIAAFVQSSHVESSAANG